MARLAALGGEPVRKDPWPKWPMFDETDLAQLREVLESGVWGVHSDKVTQFEERWAEYCGVKHAVSCANGTQSLVVTCRAAGVDVGAEVIVPSYTFVATASAVVEANGIPVFVDIEEDTFNIDPAAVEAAITPNTVAVIPVYAGGRPPDFDALGEIARKHGLVIIEDAAEAHGSEWKGRRSGSLGDMGIFSFQSSKNLTAGEGGAITTDNDRFYELCFAFRNVGRLPSSSWYEHPILGSNLRLTAFQCALLLSQMERLDEQTDRRHRNGALLSAGLAEIDGVEPLRQDPRITRHCYHLYMFRYLPDQWDGIPREKFLTALEAEGVPAIAGWPLLHEQPAIQSQRERWEKIDPEVAKRFDYSQVDLPVSRRISGQESVWFRQSMLLGTEDDMEQILAAIRKIRQNLDELRRL